MPPSPSHTPTHPHTHTPAFLPLALASIACALPVLAAASPGERVDFARQVQPLLVQKCVACHGRAQAKGGLRLDRAADALRGGDTGKAIVPGQPAASLLVKYVSGADPKVRMPPAGEPLTPAQVDLLRRWIDQGAGWTDDGDGKPPLSPPRLGGQGGASPNPQSGHWSFQPLRRPAVPALKDASPIRNPIDAFIRARLEKEGLRPSPEADPRTLIRRLYLDLLGLLPPPAEVESFVRECAAESLPAEHAEGRGKAQGGAGIRRPSTASIPPARLQSAKSAQSADSSPSGSPSADFRVFRGQSAYERLVDRLLASPHFGERWGRHWLDLARYADSDGYEKDLPRPYAYLYRDWVIDGLNRDLPFDQFTIEQLAGDLLPNATREQKIATGFHRNTLTNKEGGVDQEEYRIKAVVDRTNTTGAVWLGLTVGCAECHTHKYDPITHREYYQLFAFFNREREADLSVEIPGEKAPKAMVLEENPKPPVTAIHLRGDFLRRGETVEPGTLAVLPPLRAQAAPTRLDLARWLVSPENPLTARVTVNRVWQALFGRGLVGTPNDFGTRGEPPTHPELLDYLAYRFSQPAASNGNDGAKERWSDRATGSPDGLGWSLKALIRLIVTSATYRQSSALVPTQSAQSAQSADSSPFTALSRVSRANPQSVDPKNLLLSRQNRFRPEAEIVRDLYLSASGLLSPKIGGPSVRPPLPADIAALGYAGSVKWTESQGQDRYRRGMYIFFQRTVPYPMLVTFDSPDGNVTCTRRERSNTPLQALTLLNDPVFVECAQALGRRVLQECPGSTVDRLRFAFRATVAREPSPAELTRLQRLYQESLRLCVDPEAARKIAGGDAPAGASLAQAAAWTVVARTLLNLDEFVTRE